MKPDWNRLEYRMIGCRRRTRLTRPEAGEFVALLAITDTETGETGRFFYAMEWDKRDILDESVWTDNPALAVEDDESPSCLVSFDPNQPDQGEEPNQGDCVHEAWESPSY
jgi:hypothetical protein